MHALSRCAVNFSCPVERHEGAGEGPRVVLLTHNVDCQVSLGKHQKVLVMRVPRHCPAETGQVNHPQHLHHRKGCQTTYSWALSRICCSPRPYCWLKLWSQPGGARQVMERAVHNRTKPVSPLVWYSCCTLRPW